MSDKAVFIVITKIALEEPNYLPVNAKQTVLQSIEQLTVKVPFQLHRHPFN